MLFSEIKKLCRNDLGLRPIDLEIIAVVDSQGIIATAAEYDLICKYILSMWIYIDYVYVDLNLIASIVCDLYQNVYAGFKSVDNYLTIDDLKDLEKKDLVASIYIDTCKEMYK